MLFILFSYRGYSSSVVTLKEQDGVVLLDSNYFESIDNQGHIIPNKTLFFFTPNETSFFKYRFTLENKTKEPINRVVVSYNYTIDEFRMYFNYSQQGLDTLIFTNTIPLKDRYVHHKQPVIPITLEPGEKVDVEIWLRNESAYQYTFALYSYSEFFTHFMLENMYFGIFYGIIVFVLLFSLFYVAYFRDQVVLFYFLFTLGQIFHMMFRDGTGLYIISEHPEWAEILKSLSRATFSVFLLFYTKAFLGVSNQSKLGKIINALIIIRTVYVIIMLMDYTNITFHMEMFIILFCTLISIRSYFRTGRDAIFMSLGLVVLSITYFVYYCSVLFIPTWGKVGFFLFYYGVAFESVLMTLALIERFKQIQIEAMSRTETNTMLEQKVEERTEELNLFLYSASHDIRGPLKSIEGICKLAKVDDTIPKEQLLDMILKKVASLENYVKDLNAVTKIKSNTNQIKLIDFERIHQQITEQFSTLVKSQNVSVTLHCHSSISNYYFDEFSYRIIYQNVLENAIKYADKEKNNSFLHVTIKPSMDDVTIVFEDNGIGIPDNILPKIFLMFYRGNENSREDTGLGLYIVKLIVEKWKGSIKVDSKLKVGTTFTIVLPNKRPNRLG